MLLNLGPLRRRHAAPSVDLPTNQLTEWTRRHTEYTICLDIHGSPLISHQTTEHGNDIVSPRMVMHHEVSYGTIGRFGVQLEDSALVTDDGFEPITQAPCQLPVVG